MRSRYRDGHCTGLAGVLQRSPVRSAIWRCRQAVATGEGGAPRPEFRLPQRRLSQATFQIAELLRVVSSRLLHRSHHSKDGLAPVLIGARARREVRVIAGIVVHLCRRQPAPAGPGTTAGGDGAIFPEAALAGGQPCDDASAGSRLFLAIDQSAILEIHGLDDGEHVDNGQGEKSFQEQAASHASPPRQLRRHVFDHRSGEPTQMRNLTG